MKTLYEPTVYLIGLQKTCNDALGQFLSAEGAGDWSTGVAGGAALAEIGGRVCYMSFEKPRPGGNATYLKHIKEVGHGSVLEHAVYTFIFTGISRTCSHELVRHRAGFGFSQLSQRYVDEGRGEFVMPREIQGDKDDEISWCLAVEAAYKSYLRLIGSLFRRIGSRPENVCPQCGPQDIRMEFSPDRNCPACKGTSVRNEKRTAVRKSARGAARSVLPGATETKIQVTGNARAWRHFLEQRGSEAADIEIRSLAVKVWRLLNEQAPTIFGDYVPNSLPDGSATLTTEYRKV